MRSLERVTLVGLLFIGLSLGVGNLWYAATRSLIPLAVQGELVSKRLGVEKHPGVDDVYLLVLDRGQPLRVDREVFEQLAEGDTVYKVAWQTELNISDRPVRLKLSRDFYGLLWCMSTGLVLMLITTKIRVQGHAQHGIDMKAKD